MASPTTVGSTGRTPRAEPSPSAISVAMIAGMTMETAIPLPRTSPRSDSLRPTTACLVAEYVAPPGEAILPPIEATLTMRPRGRGHIVNVASIGGKIASPGGATYSATKHAVVGLSESLRGEVRGSGIAVSIVMPAIIATEMADGLGSARGVRPVEPTVVGEAIVRAVRRGRGADVYVPGHTGAINTAMSVMPRRWRDAIHHLMRADTVLTDVNQSARAHYNTRVGTEGKPRGDPNSAVQQP